MATMYERLSAGEYNNKLPCIHDGSFDAYKTESSRIRNQFKDDALAELGLTNHPEGNQLFEFAWAWSHNDGYRAVYEEMEFLSKGISNHGKDIVFGRQSGTTQVNG